MSTEPEQQHAQNSTTPAARNDDSPLPFWRVLLSVFQAAFGVQNQANKERDFSQGRLLPFIIAALLFTAGFIGILILVVNLVLGSEA